MKIQQIVDNVSNGTLNIPSFQRGYVWKADRLAKLIDSLYHGYPIGVITTWTQTQETGAAVNMVVDGQQRIASIYACYTDNAPATYGLDDSKPRTGLHFHILTEQFGFPSPRIRSQDPMWVKVSNLFGDPNQPTTRAWRTQIKNSPDYDEDRQDLYDEYINRVKNIKDRDISFDPIESSRTADEVVEMFDRINSENTDLKREDLEIARMSTKWPEAKESIKKERNEAVEKGTIIRTAMNEASIIRSMHAAYVGGYQRDGLKSANEAQLKRALAATSKCNQLMSRLISQNLGMYDPKSIKAVSAFPALTNYLREHTKFANAAEEARALAYVLITNAWTAYRSFTDSAIDADIKALQKQNPWYELTELIKTRLGSEPTVTSQMFRMSYKSPGRAYPLFHALSTRPEMRDWGTLQTIRSYHPATLDQHHIFPRTLLLSKYGNTKEGKRMADDIANIAVISQETNLKLGDTPPDMYLKDIADEDDKLLDQHCIPQNRTFWKIERYENFLDERRTLLAEAAKNLVNQLMEGKLP